MTTASSHAPALLTERQLSRWYGANKPADSQLERQRQAVWQRLRERYGDSEDLRQAQRELDELEGDQIVATEERVMFVVGSICMRRGQPELWTAIWDAVAGEEFRSTFLKDATARARAGKL